MQETRQNRISRLLQKELSLIFQSQTRMMHGVMVSVTKVRVSPDLSICTAYLSVFPSEKVKGVTVLYHESTYTSEQEDRAQIYNHSTAKQAAMVAKAAGVGKLLLGHYSARYNDETVLLKEAKEVFGESYLTNEGMVVSV